MDLGNSAESAAAVVGLIVGISLALGKAFGGPLMHIVEAIKSTKLINDGYSGVATIICGVLLGVTLGVLVDSLAADDYSMGVWVLLGAFAGLIMAADAMSTYKASGSVNTKAATPTIVQNQPKPGVVLEQASPMSQDITIGDYDARQKHEVHQGQGQVRSGQGGAGRSGRPLAGSQNPSGQDR